MTGPPQGSSIFRIRKVEYHSKTTWTQPEWRHPYKHSPLASTRRMPPTPNYCNSMWESCKGTLPLLCLLPSRPLAITELDEGGDDGSNNQPIDELGQE